MRYLLAIIFAIIGWNSIVIAQDVPARTLFTNVHVFKSVSAQRIKNANVLIGGNLIKTVTTSSIDAGGATVIDGSGRTLKPGITDCHWHNMAAYGAEKTLMRGFTSVRDPGEGNPANWDVVFADGAIFRHGNNGQGIYVDPKRDFCAIGFGVAINTSGTDYAPGFMRTAAKILHGE